MSHPETVMHPEFSNCKTIIHSAAEVHRPALMAPPATRTDCWRCQFATYDFDGVVESCRLSIGEACIRDDRRSPWGVR